MKRVIGPVPVDKELYERIKKKIYEKYPKHSAYRSMMIVKEYKKQGGKYRGEKGEMNIEKWIGQKWSSVNDYYHDREIVACGNTDTMKKFGEMPLCRPLAIIKALNDEQMKEMIEKKNKLKHKMLDTSEVLGTKKFDIKATKTGR